MSELFTLPVLLGILYSGIRLATPYLYAAIGEALSQRAGVLNLGVEGIMLMGAYAAFFVAWRTENLWLGLGAAALVGAAMGLMMAYISVTLRAVQGISGIGLHLFGLGLSTLLFKTTMGGVQSISGFKPIRIPILADIPLTILADIPLIGEQMFNHSILVYLAFLLVPVAHWVLNGTTLGLKIRAVGQNPAAADSLGVSVMKIRYLMVSVGGMFAGIAGASLSIALINLFQENMTNGREHDQRPGLHRRGACVLRRVEALGRAGRRAALQLRPGFAVVDSGQGHQHPFRYRSDDALPVDDPGPDVCGAALRPTGGADQAVRTGPSRSNGGRRRAGKERGSDVNRVRQDADAPTPVIKGQALTMGSTQLISGVREL